jgi:hypothetical protein
MFKLLIVHSWLQILIRSLQCAGLLKSSSEKDRCSFVFPEALMVRQSARLFDKSFTISCMTAAIAEVQGGMEISLRSI